MTNGKHPTWDDAPTLEDTPLNKRAADLMRHFYLGQGYMEPPEWTDLGADFRFGFRALAALLIDPNAVHINMLHGTLAKPTHVQIMHLYPVFARAVKALQEASDELAAMVEHHYAKTKDHPAMARRYDRDMAPVKEAIAVLGEIDA